MRQTLRHFALFLARFQALRLISGGELNQAVSVVNSSYSVQRAVTLQTFELRESNTKLTIKPYFGSFSFIIACGKNAWPRLFWGHALALKRTAFAQKVGNQRGSEWLLGIAAVVATLNEHS
eukprot:5748517-Amphidinium_carterae.2